MRGGFPDGPHTLSHAADISWGLCPLCARTTGHRGSCGLLQLALSSSLEPGSCGGIPHSSFNWSNYGRYFLVLLLHNVMREKDTHTLITSGLVNVTSPAAHVPPPVVIGT